MALVSFAFGGTEFALTGKFRNTSAWSGESAFVRFFTQVKESVWEHLKLGYCYVVLLSIAEYFKQDSGLKNQNQPENPNK